MALDQEKTQQHNVVCHLEGAPTGPLRPSPDPVQVLILNWEIVQSSYRPRWCRSLILLDGMTSGLKVD
ncbi:hypothetical protein EYF80_033493 [Liparis tanakae]|uniref:Uncharacterized protein n=1 Tax=Liparis tanakae TaxID=230148 RepID=A0A4Z2GRT9_9TELE|nr:hypothetical protein EYF80_033493 [Liparis tanakae]